VRWRGSVSWVVFRDGVVVVVLMRLDLPGGV
jgi:hypothetical protein